MAAGEVLASGPRLTRRHTAGAESAKGLLFTVLGEFVLPSGGAAWTSAFIDALGRRGGGEGLPGRRSCARRPTAG